MNGISECIVAVKLMNGRPRRAFLYRLKISVSSSPQFSEKTLAVISWAACLLFQRSNKFSTLVSVSGIERFAEP